MSRKSRVIQYEILKSSENFLPEEHARHVLLAGNQGCPCTGTTEDQVLKEISNTSNIHIARRRREIFYLLMSFGLLSYVKSLITHHDLFLVSTGYPPYIYEKIFLHFSKKVENSFWAQKKRISFLKRKSHMYGCIDEGW